METEEKRQALSNLKRTALTPEQRAELEQALLSQGEEDAQWTFLVRLSDARAFERSLNERQELFPDQDITTLEQMGGQGEPEAAPGEVRIYPSKDGFPGFDLAVLRMDIEQLLFVDDLDCVERIELSAEMHIEE